MAKKNPSRSGRKGVNKSKTIREYMAQHASEGPTEVANALNAREGWKITPAYVSTIKNKTKGTGSGKTVGGTDRLNAKALVQAKELARQAGGISQAKAALDLLAELTK